jgi:hypothetical protein
VRGSPIRPLVLTFGLASVVCAWAQAPLRLVAKPGAGGFYGVAMAESNFGPDGKRTGGSAITLPIAIRVLSATSAEVTSGPMVIKGRKVGRSRVATASLGPTAVPAPFFVALPIGGVRPGQTWKAPFFGGAPLPAGGNATYKFVNITPDKRYAVVSIGVQQDSSGRLKGQGQLFLRLSDGFLDHGAVRFEIAYLRPDQSNPKKLVVNSRTELLYTISQKRP